MILTKEVQAEGHLVDSGIMSEIFDTIIRYGGQFKVKEFRLGRSNMEMSVAKIEVKAKSEEVLNQIIGQLHLIGCYEVEPKGIDLKPAEKDGCVPNDFYSTTNHKTLVFYQNKWHEVNNQRMDSVIVAKDGLMTSTLLRDVKKGDMVVCGYGGIKVIPEFKERGRDFSFMDNDVSSERKVAVLVKKLVSLMREIKMNNEKIAIVAGPVVIHAGGTEALSKLIKKGFVDVLLTGNALVVHDAEQALFGTSLGINTKTGMQVNHGHKNHMAAINIVNKAGGIEEAVEKGVLKSGIMYECVKNKVKYVLAGSLRDDGPVKGVMMDLLEAQRQYREVLKDVKLVVMLSTMLHSIAVGNMLPSYVKTVCVDINPAVIIKLVDRGSAQATGIVTDVGLFLELLGKELNG